MYSPTHHYCAIFGSCSKVELKILFIAQSEEKLDKILYDRYGDFLQQHIRGEKGKENDDFIFPHDLDDEAKDNDIELIKMYIIGTFNTELTYTCFKRDEILFKEQVFSDYGNSHCTKCSLYIYIARAHKSLPISKIANSLHI